MAVEGHHQQPVGDLGRGSGHHRPEGAEQHRRRSPLQRAGAERRWHQGVPGVLAAEVQPGAVLPGGEDRLHREHDLAHPGGRRAPRGAVPVLDVRRGPATRARAGTGRRSSAGGRARCARGAWASGASRSPRWSSGRSRPAAAAAAASGRNTSCGPSKVNSPAAPASTSSRARRRRVRAVRRAAGRGAWPKGSAPAARAVRFGR